jgi:hypothetical protein
MELPGTIVPGKQLSLDFHEWCTQYSNRTCSLPSFRHGQMTNSLFDVFEGRGMAVQQYLSGNFVMSNGMMDDGQPLMVNDIQPLNDSGGMGMDLFGGAGGMEHLAASLGGGDMRPHMAIGGHLMGSSRRERNPSIVSFGNLGNLRMSLTGRMSEISYGRAMSGLSALSIDWENMEDFDINVDHSEHINANNNAALGAAATAAANAMGGFELGAVGARRSSMRHPLVSGGPGADGDAHVSFKV